MIDVLRKEIKYIIPLEKFTKLSKKLEVMMKRDGSGNNGEYMVRSQYFDSVIDRDLADNMDGVMEKRKIRTRIYNINATTAKLEYKCKSNTDGRKLSLEISKQEAIDMENGKYEFLLDKEEELAKFLYVKMTQNGYQPKTIVVYQRKAYLYPVNDLRITFDTQVKGTINPYGLFNEKISGIPVLSQDLGILEVKYNHFIPAPFKHMIDEIDNITQANSKYSVARLLV